MQESYNRENAHEIPAELDMWLDMSRAIDLNETGFEELMEEFLSKIEQFLDKDLDKTLNVLEEVIKYKEFWEGQDNRSKSVFDILATIKQKSNVGSITLAYSLLDQIDNQYDPEDIDGDWLKKNINAIIVEYSKPMWVPTGNYLKFTDKAQPEEPRF